MSPRSSSAPSLAVAGASGYVGSRLVARLAASGTPVRALARDGRRLPSGPGVEARSVDVGDVAATTAALEGVRAAYYLVHAMAEGEGFAERDRRQAQAFGEAAAAAKVQRIVYLGGLGADELSEHLSSRQEVGQLLGSGGVPVVELRAAVIIGAGSISFEMLRYLTERLPVMVCPRWIDTRLQPLAERDLLDYLEQAPGVAPGTYEIGSPDVTTYGEMMRMYAEIRGLRRRRVVKVPLLTPSLSAHWVDLVSPVDRKVSHALIESLTSEVVVHHPGPTAEAFDVRPLPVYEALRQALVEQADRMPDVLLDAPEGLTDGIYAMRSSAPLPEGLDQQARLELDQCGGDLAWYGLAWAWRLRFLLGWLFGEHLQLRHPAEVVPGAKVDWWTVEHKDEECLVLGTTEWFCGEAWLGYRIPVGQLRMEQVGALRPKGALGFVYWRLLWPIHLLVFRSMVRLRVRRARLVEVPTPSETAPLADSGVAAS